MEFLKDYLRYKKYQFYNYRKYNYKFKFDTIHDSEIKKLKDDGYVLIKNFLSIDECLKIKKIIQEFIENKPNLLWRDKLDSDNRIFGAENISKDFSLLVEKFIKFTKEIGEHYLNQKIQLYMTMANRTLFKNDNFGSGDGWHKDSYSKQFKSILYLNDVSKDNGPFQIVKNSRSDFFLMKLFLNLRNKYPSTRFEDSEIRKILKNYENQIVEFTAPAGSLILADTSLIHRGKPLINGTRFALTNYFYPKEKFSDYKDHFKPMIKKNFN